MAISKGSKTLSLHYSITMNVEIDKKYCAET